MKTTTGFSLWLLLLLSGYSPFYIESRLMLSPSGVAMVCSGATLAITCSTDRRFLNWTVTIPPSASESGQAVTRSRLFSSNTQIVEPLIVAKKAFNISITSTMDPFSSVLSSTNITDDLNGTVIDCSDRGYTAAESRLSTTIVHIITADLVSSNPLRVVTRVSNLGVDDITLTLSWPQQDSSVSYNVIVVPRVAFIEGFSQGSRNVTVTIAYNTPYIVNVVASLCGRNISNTTTTLNYVKCDNVLHLLGSEDGSVQVNGYSDPAFMGTIITLECTLLNHVLIESNATTCMGNGKWQPDPRETKCIADCGVPFIDSSLNLTHVYNSTLEGSGVVVQCDGFVVTAFCHRNGSWSPQLTDSICNFTTSSMVTESDPDQTLVSYTVTIITTVVISVVILFNFSFVVIVCTCLCCIYKQSSKASPDGQTVYTQSSQPTQPVPVYETVMECTNSYGVYYSRSRDDRECGICSST